MIKISSKYGIKNYVHNGHIIHFRRIHGGIGFPGCAMIVGEEFWDDQINYYLLAEIHEPTTYKLVESIQDFHKRYRKLVPVNEWFGRHTKTTEQIFDRCNAEAFDNKKPMTHIANAPGEGDNICYHVESILKMFNPKILHLFNESRAQAALQNVPKEITDLKNTKDQVVTALGYAVTSLVDFPYYDASEIVLKKSNY